MNVQDNLPCPTEQRDQGQSPNNPPATGAAPTDHAPSVTRTLPTQGPKVLTGTNCAHLGCP